MADLFKTSAFAAVILTAGLCAPALSAARSANASEAAVHNGVDEFSARGRGGGGHVGGGGARAGGGGHVHAGGAARMHAGGAGRVHVNASRRTNVNVNVRRTNVVAVGRRPVRGWVRRPYYGAVVGGVVIGTVIGATIVGTAPVAPAENLCWFWSDPAYTQGYWDYCVAP
jgi:hypothetical protein